MKSDQLTFPATVYMAPTVTEHMSIATWKYSKQLNIIMQPIPDSVFREVLKRNETIFDHIKPAFEKMVTDK